MKRISVVLIAAIILSTAIIIMTQSISLDNSLARADSQPLNTIGNSVANTKQDFPDKNEQGLSSVSTQDWADAAIGEIIQSEYRINWQESTYLDDVQSAYHATNRSQNLRAYFTSEGVRILKRSDSQSSWDAGLHINKFESRDDLISTELEEISAFGNRIQYQRGNLTESYTNNENGLEHSITINEPQSDLDLADLWLSLEISGDLLPSLSKDRSALILSENSKSILRYGNLIAYDASETLLPVQAEIDGMELLLKVQSEGAAFPIILNATIEGIVTDYSWREISDQVGANMGASVSTAGDVNNDGYADIIIGAPHYDNGQSDEGRAFVYHGSSTGLPTIANWSVESNQEGAQMGVSVSTAGNVNGDTYDDVIIGANLFDTDDGTDAGRVYVFHGSSSGLSMTPDWTADGDTDDALLGEAVSTAGDINNDGYDDVIIGAPGWTIKGRVYVYHGSSSGLSLSADSTYFDSNVTNLGVSVDTAGDVNGDNYDDVIMGASFSSTYAGGVAFLHYGSSTTLSPTADWATGITQTMAGYGLAVSSAGDVNNDGYSEIIVGAPDYDTDIISDTGKVFVYHGSSSGPSTIEDWSIEGEIEFAAFGNAVDNAGDVNGDGFSDVVIGAFAYDNIGRAYVYQGSTTGLGTSPEWFADGEQSFTGFGASVGGAGDVNGDNTDDIIIGASEFFQGGITTGAAYVYYGIPDLAASNDSPTILGNTTSLTATLTIAGSYEFTWDFGDGSPTQTGQYAGHIYPAVGMYTAVVTATGGAVDLFNTTDVIIDEEISGLYASNDSPTALGSLTSLSASVTAGSNITYEWDFGDGSPNETGQNVTHTYPALGDYTATVTATNSVSSDSTTTSVTIDQTIAGLYASNDSPTALGSLTSLSASVTAGSNITYEWDFGDGSPNETGQNVTHTYPTLGDYTATVTATNSISSDSTTTSVTIDQTIAGLYASNDSPTALGSLTSLSASVTAGNNVTYEWDFGDGSPTETAQNVTHTYPAVGNYTATVTATNSVSSDSTTTSVTVDQTIAGLSASNDSPTALGSLTSLSASVTAGSNITYEWDFGDGSPNETGQNVTHTYPTVGDYIATVTATNSVSSDSTTTSVAINQTITGLSATNDSPTTLGETTTLTATISAGSNVTYEWDFGDGSPAETGKEVTHVYASAGIYTATVTATNNVSQSATTTTVYVDQIISGLNAVNDGPTQLGEITTLSAWVVSGTNITYTWELGDGSPDKAGQVVTHTYPGVQTYIATVTAENSVSKVTTTTEVVIDPLMLFLPVILFK